MVEIQKYIQDLARVADDVRLWWSVHVHVHVHTVPR